MESDKAIAFSVHPSVAIWLSVLFYCSPWTLLPFLLAVAVHELGHYLALSAMCHPPEAITFTCLGAGMEAEGLSYRQELLAAVAGPFASLLFALLIFSSPLLSAYSLVLGLFNLLPLPGLDGYRMVRSGLLQRLSAEQAERISHFIGLLTALVLCAAGWYLTMMRHYGLWPVLLAALLLVKAWFQTCNPS